MNYFTHNIDCTNIRQLRHVSKIQISLTSSLFPFMECEFVLNMKKLLNLINGTLLHIIAPKKTKKIKDKW
jgi:hypothetical protein